MFYVSQVLNKIGRAVCKIMIRGDQAWHSITSNRARVLCFCVIGKRVSHQGWKGQRRKVFASVYF